METHPPWKVKTSFIVCGDLEFRSHFTQSWGRVLERVKTLTPSKSSDWTFSVCPVHPTILRGKSRRPLRRSLGFFLVRELGNSLVPWDISFLVLSSVRFVTRCVPETLRKKKQGAQTHTRIRTYWYTGSHSRTKHYHIDLNWPSF